MNTKTKLILALMQIDNITTLIKGNEYEKYLHHQLILTQIELKRQLSNLNQS